MSTSDLIPRRIAIGADHAGFALKEEMKKHLVSRGMIVDDLGTGDGTTSVDYPSFADAEDVGVVVLAREARASSAPSSRRTS